MSKAKIVKALKAKGYQAERIEYASAPSYGYNARGWFIELSAMSEHLAITMDANCDPWEQWLINTADVLEWIGSLPDIGIHSHVMPKVES